MIGKKRMGKISWVFLLSGLVWTLAACVGAGGADYQVVAPATINPGDPIPPPSGDVILTLSGDLSATNVGDTLQLDMKTLEGLGLVEYEVEDPWLKTKTTYTGILMSDLAKLAGFSPEANAVHMTALDDYEIDILMSDIERWPILLATRSNGEYMDIEHSGPTRIIFPYDTYAIDAVRYNDLWIWNLESMEVN